MNRKAKNTSHVASSKTQSYSYACAYAIQVSPVGNKESDGLATFLHDDGGETVWIGQSLFFGTAEQALVNGCSKKQTFFVDSVFYYGKLRQTI